MSVRVYPADEGAEPYMLKVPEDDRLEFFQGLVNDLIEKVKLSTGETAYVGENAGLKRNIPVNNNVSLSLEYGAQRILGTAVAFKGFDAKGDEILYK